MSNYQKPAIINFIDSIILPLKLLIDWEVPFAAKIIPITIFVIYLLLPIDFISDFIPIVGTIDDIAVLSACCYLMVRLTPNHIVQKYLTDNHETIVEPKKKTKQIPPPRQ
ncbi:MAG TPA: DUF1232 domain-containing protein [bacterium]|nr:DUF1232 domain-containing protein [bacterium]